MTSLIDHSLQVGRKNRETRLKLDILSFINGYLQSYFISATSLKREPKSRRRPFSQGKKLSIHHTFKESRSE